MSDNPVGNDVLKSDLPMLKTCAEQAIHTARGASTEAVKAVEAIGSECARLYHVALHLERELIAARARLAEIAADEQRHFLDCAQAYGDDMVAGLAKENASLRARLAQHETMVERIRELEAYQRATIKTMFPGSPWPPS